MNSFPKLSYACPIPWSSLSGDERAKFCTQCGRTITNLSELDEKARLALLANASGEKICITYYRRLSGEFITPESPLTTEERASIKQLGVAALSAGALALAAGCMTTNQPPNASAPSAPPISAPSAEEKTAPPLSEPLLLARHDKNRNGKLDPDEISAMQAEQAETIVLQPFGVMAEVSPAQTKRAFDRRIQMERNKESADPGAGPFSVEGWQQFWAEIIKDLRNPRQMGGPNPAAEEYVRYIISQRRKFRLPELKFPDTPPSR